MSDENKVADTINAVTGLAKAVPVYEDALQPAAKEIGKSLHTVARAVNVALAPLKVMIWGWEQIELAIVEGMKERLADVPPERIIPPDATVAGPLIEALRFAGHKEELRELYNNLLAKAMDSETARYAHPAFVEILKQLSPDEARIVKLFVGGQNFPVITIWSVPVPEPRGFGSTRDWELKNFSLLPYDAGCEHPDLGPSYLDNLCRLGLGVIPDGGISTTTSERYPPLRKHPVIVKLIREINSRPNREASVDEEVIRVTTFGKQFALAIAR